MNSKSLVFLSLLGVFLFGFSAGAARLEGTYALVRDKSTQEDLQRSIHNAIKDMNFLIRPIAESKLRHATLPCKIQMIVQVSREELWLNCDQHPRAKTKPDGPFVRYTDADEKTYRLQQRLEGDDIVQVLASEDGERTSRFHLRADGKLEVATKIVSPRLGAPVEYQLVYKRIGNSN